MSSGGQQEERELVGGVPIGTYWYEHAIPDLSVLPREDWLGVLLALPDRAVAFALNRYVPDGLSGALDVYGACVDAGLRAADGPREEPHVAALRAATRLPVPEVDVRPSARRRRMLNVRLHDEEHDLLARAAERLGMRPSQLARALVLNGSAATLTGASPRSAPAGP